MRKPGNIGISLLLGFLILCLCHPLTAQTTQAEALKQIETEQYDSAIVSFTELINQNPETRELYFNRGLAYYYTQNFDSAEHDFENSIVLDSPCPHCQDAVYMSCLIYQQLGNYHKALSGYKILESQSPGYKDVNKRIKICNAIVYISENWYYMIAIAVIFFIIIALLSSILSAKRG